MSTKWKDMKPDDQLMFMLAQSVEVPPEGHTSVTFIVPGGSPAHSIPRRILVREAPRIRCSYRVEVRGLRVGEGLMEEGYGGRLHEIDRLWPAVSPADTVIVEIANPGKKKTTSSLGLCLISDPARYRRLEQTTPPLTAADGSYTVVLHVVETGRILRFEFETRDQWGPEGWNVEQIIVANNPQMMGVIPVEILSSAPQSALLFETARTGTSILAMVKRVGSGPAEALTVRAVINPISWGSDRVAPCQ